MTAAADDRAVGVAHAIASRLLGDNAAAFGDADDMYGGIGRNGAVRMKPAEAVGGQLLGKTGEYSFRAGLIHDLLADEFVANHGDVSNEAVASAVVAAIERRA